VLDVERYECEATEPLSATVSGAQQNGQIPSEGILKVRVSLVTEKVPLQV
jgi:hypothetical protein